MLGSAVSAAHGVALLSPCAALTSVASPSITTTPIKATLELLLAGVHG